MPFIFPFHRLTPESFRVDVVEKVISGGQALNGDEDVISTDGGGRWEGSFSGFNLRTPFHERLWGAWASHFKGGARQVLMPIYSLRTAPRPIGGNGLLRPPALVDDDEYFPTSVAFAAPYIKAKTVGAVALRGTTITILVEQGARLEPGMKFGCGVRAFKIERITARSGMQATCIVTPPAREAIPDGAVLNFDWPVVLSRAVSGQEFAAEMQFGRFGQAAVSFVEDFSDAQ